MYARLRQKLAISAVTTTVTTPTSLGDNAMSLLMKDIARLMTGAITSTAGLNSELWDTANSEIVNTVPAGWSEYQSTYTTTATNIGSANFNVIYLRCPSLNTTSTNQPIYKYAGIGWAYTSATTSNTLYKLHTPYGISDHVGNPTLAFGTFGGSSYTQAPRFKEDGLIHEVVLYVTPRVIFWSATVTTATQPYCIITHLEYPSTPLSTKYNHPNQVVYGVSNGDSNTTTGTGTAFGGSAYYNIAGGFVQAGNSTSDMQQGSLANLVDGKVYTHTTNMSAGGWTCLWSSATAAAEATTLKPSIFGSMANTVDSSGNTISIPAMPLIYYPAWDTVYDCSSLTGVYATKPSLGATGDTLTLNGKTYAYINATTMAYLVPKE